MTLVGKILVVLILLMSMLFMAFTVMVYATHTNWKDAVENPQTGLRAQLQAKTQDLNQLEAQRQEALNKLTRERAARTKALGVLEARSRELDEQLAKKEEEFRNLQIENRDALKTLDTKTNEMTRLTDEVNLLRGDIRDTRQDRDAQVAAVRELTDKLNQGEGQLRRLKERNGQLVSELSTAKLIMDQNDLSVDAPIDGKPPQLDGVVTAVRKTNLVEVSLGADEGIRRGHKLDIYTGSGSYVGRVVVIETNPDRAVGRIIPEFLQGVVRKGNRVATRLL